MYITHIIIMSIYFICVYMDIFGGKAFGGGGTRPGLRCQTGHVPENLFEGGGPLPGPEGVTRYLQKSPDRLYKAPKQYTKTQNIRRHQKNMQNPKK